MEQPINNRTLDAKEWALTVFISGLPIIGFIMVLVWAFSEGNIHRKNWAQGTLILMVIAIAIALAFLFLFGGLALVSNWLS
jgi:hypothetical protein